MSNDDLLKPRWKVIAAFPDNRNYEVGSILDRDWCRYVNDEDESEGVVWRISNFPHLFKKLEWWEERKEDELPKYVIIKNKIIPVKKWLIESNSVWLNVEYPDPSFMMGSKYYPSVFPATEEEYDVYCQTESQNEA